MVIFLDIQLMNYEENNEIILICHTREQYSKAQHRATQYKQSRDDINENIHSLKYMPVICQLIQEKIARLTKSILPYPMKLNVKDHSGKKGDRIYDS